MRAATTPVSSFGRRCLRYIRGLLCLQARLAGKTMHMTLTSWRATERRPTKARHQNHYGGLRHVWRVENANFDVTQRSRLVLVVRRHGVHLTLEAIQGSSTRQHLHPANTMSHCSRRFSRDRPHRNHPAWLQVQVSKDLPAIAPSESPDSLCKPIMKGLGLASLF